MLYRISGLDPQPYRHLYGLSDQELSALGVRRQIADTKPGFPDRIEVRDAEPGESLLLLNYEHQTADTPYRSRHAILIREGAEAAYEGYNTIPDVLKVRPISLRAFTTAGEMADALLVDGAKLEAAIERLLALPAVDYLHAHYATRGCYGARVDRAEPARAGTAGGVRT